jgi:carbonic anhydrase/acetyltransferase-like protein (isoleucine patch superfamily)
VETGALVGAGAVVSGGTIVPAGAMALGIPAKIRPDAVTPEMISLGMQSYVTRGHRYRSDLRRLD